MAWFGKQKIIKKSIHWMHPDHGFQVIEMTIPKGISGLLPSLLPLVPGLFH